MKTKNDIINLKRKNMDNYMKFVLTIIAVGIIGINFQLFSGDIISKANASSHNKVLKIAICTPNGLTCSEITDDKFLTVATAEIER